MNSSIIINALFALASSAPAPLPPTDQTLEVPLRNDKSLKTLMPSMADTEVASDITLVDSAGADTEAMVEDGDIRLKMIKAHLRNVRNHL
jgi:hypothetical protein